MGDGELTNLEEQGEGSGASSRRQGGNASKGKIAGAFRTARNPVRPSNNESIEDMLIKAGLKKGSGGGPKSAFAHQTDFTQVPCHLNEESPPECLVCRRGRPQV